jgi:sialate O-acetylesterase
MRWLAILLLGMGFVGQWPQSAKAADLKLPAIFGDNMVLQRGVTCPVWGSAEAGEKVTVSLLDQKKETVAGPNGKWMVKLDALTAGGPYELSVAGGSTITLKNVMVGEVWVCSGQSNMEMALRPTRDGMKAAQESHNPMIRLFTVAKNNNIKPASDVKGNWAECESDVAKDFSAVGYYFGRELQKELKVPVGLIHTSWGGTPIEVWLSRRAMAADANMGQYLDSYDKRLAQYEAALSEHNAQLAAAKLAGKPAPKAPPGPGWSPGVLYNNMIAPLLPYAIGGTIWYQGESNAGQAYLYRKQMPAMIKQWREDFACGEFPFLMVQLANFMDRKTEPTDTPWAELREAQTMTARSTPKTGMAVIIDIGEAKDIHPRNKEDVGKRLALAAEAIGYGRKIVYSGPLYESIKVEGNQARLSFSHVGGGLVAQGGETLKGFAIAGADKKFVWADAKIDGDSIVVSSSAVPQPAAVRYAWADNPECNLYNKEGLPASPFRTDDWVRPGAK